MWVPEKPVRHWDTLQSHTDTCRWLRYTTDLGSLHQKMLQHIAEKRCNTDKSRIAMQISGDFCMTPDPPWVVLNYRYLHIFADPCRDLHVLFSLGLTRELHAVSWSTLSYLLMICNLAITVAWLGGKPLQDILIFLLWSFDDMSTSNQSPLTRWNPIYLL